MKIWEELFTDRELDDIEDMFLDGCSIDRIYEEFFNFHWIAIRDGDLSADKLYRAIKAYVRDMEWKKSL